MKADRIAPSGKTSALEALAPADRWSSIQSSNRTPMQHFIWNEACFATMYDSASALILMTDGGIAPFVRKGLLSTLYLAGAEELAEPSEPHYRDAESAARLAKAVLKQGLPVRLGQPPADSPFTKAFLAGACKSGFVLTDSTEGSPFLDLTDGWEDPLARFTSRRRSDFRRMQRRAEEEGPVTFEFHAPTPDEALPLLERAIEVESRSWKSRAGTSLSDNSVQRHFFEHYARLASAEGIFRVEFMKIGEVDVAAQIAAECDDSLWLFKIGYDEAYSRCSPGQLLMMESIGRSARGGLKRYEMLGKAADWTRFWTQDERPRMKLRYYPRNAIGVAALAKDATLLGMKRIAASAKR
jgi:CelD/BcsL family acetyltransferase involved in cellulose biosynthesis